MSEQPQRTETLISTPGLLARVTQRRGVRQFVKFGIVGFSGLFVNLVVFTILQHYTPLDERGPRYNLFFSTGFLAGGISNYCLNRIWTFRSKGSAFVQGMQFLTVSAIALIVGLVASQIASPYLGRGHRAWFLATASGIIVNFFVNKYWTFNEGRSPAA